MSKAPTDAELGAALRVILSALGGTAAASPPATTSTAGSKPSDKPAAGGTAPEGKADGPAEGNTNGYTPEQFSVEAITMVKTAAGGPKVGGPICRDLLKPYGTEQLTVLDPSKYDEFLAALKEKIDETHVPS